MTISTPNISITEGNLVVHGRTILTAVPDNIGLTAESHAGLVTGAFMGATAESSKSFHVFPVGVLEGLRFMCLFRYKIWWMTQRMGRNGIDIPLETQFMLVESKLDAETEDDQSAADPTIYTVFLPLLEGQFRAVLQGNEKNEMEICLESGDNAVETRNGVFLVYIHAGTDPFEVIYQAVKAVEKHLQTFCHLQEKKLPSFLDWFGWCTWDAFYTDVTAEGVEAGLKSLSGGGFSPKFLIIDDGWQTVENDGMDNNNCIFQEESHFTNRLTSIKENEKFQKSSLKNVIEKAKKNHNVKYVYLWHALAGYWGGVKPAAVGMEMEIYGAAMEYPIQSPGVLGNQPDVVMDILVVHGMGIVDPKKVFSFYNDLHGYLASCGVDGVKVDVQNVVETVGAGHGGRVSLTHDYLQALEASIERNFVDNGCIACMCHNSDGIYNSKWTAVVRASDDFYPRDPASHTMHVSSVAYNSVFLGEFMQPDWDMFHSLHPAAEYHAAARAIGGCPIYVSDKPGNHNFDLLKKLVLPDGSVLRGQLPGRPTLDCLFVDPTRDGKSLLKIWNVNKCSGVVGVFNCQGAGWCKEAKKILIHDTSPGQLTGHVKAEDVVVLPQIAGPNWNGDSVVFAHKAGEVMHLKKGESTQVTLKVLEHEVFHFCPLKEISECVFFAPMGLLDMFNCGGAVEEFDDHANPVLVSSVSHGQLQETWIKTVALTVRGCGRFGAYSSRPPHKCLLDGVEIGFEYEADRGLLILAIPVPKEEMYRWKVEIEIHV